MKVDIGEYPEDSETPRRQEIEIHTYDVWSMDHTLALIIHPMLIKLKENKHGYPCLRLIEECWDSSKRSGDCLCVNTWNDILDKMIWSFKQIVERGSDESEEKQYFSGETDRVLVPLKNGNSMVTHGPNHTFKIDHDGLQKYNDRIQEGLELFGKHYQSLWD